MIVTWTTLRSSVPVSTVPWQPRGSSWWQSGPASAGRTEPPLLDGAWWSVLPTWPTLAEAEAGPGQRERLHAWQVVLETASSHGDAVLAGGARPFDGVPQGGRTEGASAVLTFARTGADAAREREFFRRFPHLGRGVAQAPGHLAAVVQAPADGAVLTFPAWEDLGPALDWAYAQPQHAAAVARQRARHLVEASGSLRCAVLSSSGTLGDVLDPLAGLTGTVVGAGRASAPPAVPV